MTQAAKTIRSVGSVICKKHSLGKKNLAKRRAFASAFRAERAKLGLSCAAFAEKIGVSPQQINNIELAHTAPSWEVFLEICAVLGIKVPLVG